MENLIKDRSSLDLFYVIHNYNYNVGNLGINFDNSIIFDCSDDKNQNMEKITAEIIQTNNYGHNLISYLTYIIDNYDYLPLNIAFLKSNIIGRHVTPIYWKNNYQNNHYTLLWEDPTPRIYKKNSAGYRLGPGLFIELNNSWYVWDHPHRYFTDYNDMLDFLFIDSVHPAWVPFAPGGCYIVERRQILKYPKSFYQGLVVILEYGFLPSEAYILERMLHTIWLGMYQVREYVNNLSDFLSIIDKLLDKSNDKNPHLRLRSKIRRVFSA